jgi:hypothetical protein
LWKEIREDTMGGGMRNNNRVGESNGYTF